MPHKLSSFYAYFVACKWSLFICWKVVVLANCWLAERERDSDEAVNLQRIIFFKWKWTEGKSLQVLRRTSWKESWLVNYSKHLFLPKWLLELKQFSSESTKTTIERHLSSSPLKITILTYQSQATLWGDTQYHPSCYPARYVWLTDIIYMTYSVKYHKLINLPISIIVISTNLLIYILMDFLPPI